MIPLVVGGIFLAGLIALRDAKHSHRGWQDEREYQQFMRKRESWSKEMIMQGFFQY